VHDDERGGDPVRVGRVSAGDPIIARALHEGRRIAEQIASGEIKMARVEPPADFVQPSLVPVPFIPERFAAVTFDSYAAQTESEKVAVRAARKWVERTLQKQPVMLALIGTTGVGKSHLLYAAARALYEQGVTVYSRPWYELADQLRYGRSGREAAEVREELWKARVVLIDEVRKTAGTEFDDTELAKFACHAYDRGASVFLTTNVNPLDSVMGPPAASRFAQVVVTGKDRRQL
jgi:chromosomal replication initiation ATPase DnaA